MLISGNFLEQREKYKSMRKLEAINDSSCHPSFRQPTSTRRKRENAKSLDYFTMHTGVIP